MVKYTRALTFENFSQRIIHLSKMHENREVRQMTNVDPGGLAPALLDKKEHSGGWQAWERGMKRLFLKPRHVYSADEVREPVRSIDQLYLQAKTMVPYLSRLVQVWAHQSDGIFRVERTHGEAKTYSFEKWRVLQEEIAEGSFSGTIAFAKLKLISRMIEKTQRCYKGDASRLADLCRAAVAFESLEDLANCLGRNSEKSLYSDFTAQL
jgi:hypothetical protein